MSNWWRSRFTLPSGELSFCEMWGTQSEVTQIAQTRGFDAPKKYRGVVQRLKFVKEREAK